jgi:glyoxylase-like metal-dependent hydrolase (beta-lactamase superfamily II)
MDGFPFDPDRMHDGDFKPSGSLNQLSENLYLFEDSCNVYIVKQGDRALLIDFGTGDVLERLSEVGVNQVEQVLVTHHHRDQVQGLCDLKDYDFKVTVPAAEAHYFEDVESFWRDLRVYLNYDCRSHFNTIRQSVRVDEKVKGEDRVNWKDIQFKVLDTPGPTDTCVSYSAEIDGQRVIFSGDLIAGIGKVHNWFDLHWGYYGFTQGINASDESFARIRAENPDWLLPSHGDPIGEPEEAMSENSRIHVELRDMLLPNELHRTMGTLRNVLPHLVHLGGLEGRGLGGLTSWAIISDSGKALIYDTGYFDLEQIDLLKEKFNVDNIDIATFSHYHDDHLIRAHDLLRDNRTEFWVFENMVDVLENPTRYRLPCLIPFPIKADRVVHDGEKVQWEEYTLEFFHMPGQTEFHQGMITEIDGRKVMFTGDNTWKKIEPEKFRNGPVVPQNEYFLDGGFITCAKKMLYYMPDIVCPAHTEEYSPTKEDLEEFLDWAYRVRDVMTGLIHQPDPNFGMDYRWSHFYPYRTETQPGEPFEVELAVRNHLFKSALVEIQLKHSDRVTCLSSSRMVTIEPKTQVAIPFTLNKNDVPAGQRVVITADLTINGQRLGEVTEALID